MPLLLRPRPLLQFIAALALLALNLAGRRPGPPLAPAIFDTDSNHLWNRTHASLWLRTEPDGTQYGADSLDPPLWPRTRHLLTGDSHRQALARLDDFITNHGERLIQDPLKRAIFQRDLWAVYDWFPVNTEPTRPLTELRLRLARIIRSVSLTSGQIHALGDNYALAVAGLHFAPAYDPAYPRKPFLPPDLFASDGPWVCLSAFSDHPTAMQHFSGRSRFLVFIRLPAGRQATLAYVRKLRDWPEPSLIGDNMLLNLNLPQFPAGTEVALVRQAILIDAAGNLVPTAITESVQFRVYHAVTPGGKYMNYINGPASKDEDYFEFRLSRRELFANYNGGLVGVRPDDTEYATFNTHGFDPFESRLEDQPIEPQSEILARCIACHVDSGIHSVQSRQQWVHHPTAAAGDPIAWETLKTISRKQHERGFQSMLALWH